MQRQRWRRIARLLVLAPISVFVVGCFILVSNGVRTESLDKSALPVDVSSPVKAHLTDGSTVVYPDGITVTDTHVAPRKRGMRFSATQRDIAGTTIMLDSIVGLESYTTRTSGAASFFVSTLATGGAILLGAAAAVAIFGSCPTIYVDSAGTPVLQAEVFATRISPLLEARDIDLLSARVDSAGEVTLEVRNEALETHYINHFELLDVRHPLGLRVIPDEHGRPLALGALAPPASARDRAGRDLRDVVARRDDVVFSTDSGTLAHATGDDPFDFVDIAIPSSGADSVVVAMHLRNSLLNTVLLYELMLGEQGARSIDWMSRDMQRIGSVLKFGRWYRQNFGLRISVWDGTRYRHIERHPTYGPVAWREAATVVPVLERDSVRVRLAFMADEWRIDWIGATAEFSRPRPRLIAIDRVRATNDSIAAITKRNLREADDRYVQTSPGERFWVTFRPGVVPAGTARTFLLASQGYYSEWIRGSWIKQASDTARFDPSKTTVERTLRRWSAQRDTLDQAFFSTRIPMRER
jgi:hypothetical protein